MIIFLLMNFIVILSSFLITYRLFQIPNFIDSLICWFITYLTQIVLSELILGILGVLYLNNVILINLLLLLVIWLLSKNRTSSLDLSKVIANKNKFVKNKIIILAICVIFCFSLVKISINLVNPPFGWDSLNYHFTFPVEWLKHGNLDNPITISDDPSPSYYPINGSLYFLWLMLPIKNVFLADLGQIPFFILAFLAVYSLGIKLNLSRENSYFASCLFTLIPNYFKEIEIAYVDVMIAALFLASLNYLLLLKREFLLKYVLIFSATLGLFLGTKTVALPYSILLLIPFIYLCFRNANKSYALVLSFLTVIILGGLTYIRSFIEIGNPLYPLDFKLFGKTIFKGVMEPNTYGVHFRIEDYSLFKLLFHEGLGVQSIVFILSAMFLALPVALIKKRKSLNFYLVYFLLLPFLIYLVYRYIIPLANTRYLYPLLGVGIIIAFYTAEILNIPEKILKILVVICILASISELANRLELVTSIILTFLLFFLLPLLIKNIPRKGWIRKPSFVSVLVISLVIILMFLEKDYVKNEYPRYIKMQRYSGFWPDATRAWDWLNKNTQGNNIAYVGRPVPFPLYGTNFKNNVYYVSVNKTDPAKLHYFLESYYRWDYDFLSLHRNLEAKGNYRGDADYSIWLNNLLKRNTDYLFVYSFHQTKEIKFPLEDKWAKANPDKFISVFINETIHIYRILR